MSNSDDLISRIKVDLVTSGFSSEMSAIKMFWEEGWDSYGSQSFFDLDEGKSWEFDVSASTRLLGGTKSGAHCVIFFDIIAEVKKANKPWVVFRHNPNSEEDLEVGWSDVLHTDLNLPVSGPDLTHTFETTSLARINGWKGYGVHESFKNPSQPSQWYSAFVTACKAAHHTLQINDLSELRDPQSEYDPSQSSRLHLVKPVVIVDGPLFSAELTDANDIKIEPISSASVSFQFETKNYDLDHSTFNVAIITLDYVKNFAKLCKRVSEKGL